MNRRAALGIAVALAAALVFGVLRQGDGPPAQAGDLAVGRVLGAVDLDPGFARAREPRTFEFPADHGPHPEFRTEWWYFTGNLADSGGRPFGFQLTFFRHALTPAVARSASAWRSRDVMLAHFAISDIAAGRFLHAARTERAALDLAGAGGTPPVVWLRDWRCELVAPDTWQLRAENGEYALDLRVALQKPLVPQGDRGLSRKSSEPGNASYYYSGTRLAADGAVMIGGKRTPVSGTAWLDREWSTSALGPGQVGWDWFALQLRDGSDLMFYQLRDADGSSDAHSQGIYVTRAGETRRLGREDVRITVTSEWRSARSGARYPARWRLEVPREKLDLEIEPRLADQEWTGTLVYWEGAVGIRSRGAPAGAGYVELTGYTAAKR